MNTKELNILFTNRLLAILAGSLLVLGCRALRAQASRTITLERTATILVVPNEPEPVQHAAEDLASDLQRVTGETPKIVSREADAGRVTIVVGEETKLPEQMRMTRR